MNFAMWRKALNVIPDVSKSEWDALDVISKWLISTRAAVLIMTFISAALAGLFAWRDGAFSFVPWLFLTLGLILAHASNNIFNDYTDFVRGVDKDNYYRNIYGAQPVASGLMTKRQHLTYFVVTVLAAVFFGLSLLYYTGFSTTTWILIGLGAFFLLFYTWPLKGLALGELAVLIVWGPLMIGGGYYVLTQTWSWNVVVASLPYVLGVTTVIFGKHIDKLDHGYGKGHSYPAGGDRRKSLPLCRSGNDDCSLYFHGVPDRHQVFYTCDADRLPGASHLPADLSQISETQTGDSP